MNRAEQNEWAEKVINQLKEKSNLETDEFCEFAKKVNINRTYYYQRNRQKSIS